MAMINKTHYVALSESLQSFWRFHASARSKHSVKFSRLAPAFLEEAAELRFGRRFGAEEEFPPTALLRPCTAASYFSTSAALPRAREGGKRRE